MKLREKMSFNDALGAFILLVYFAELIFPPITVILPSATVCLVCFLAWLFVCFSTCRSFLLIRDNFFYLAVLMILIITPYFFGYSVIAHRYTNMELVICGSIIMNYYYDFEKTYILKRVLVIIGILAIITMIVTLSRLMINPYISRSIKSSGEYSFELSRQGIGGYKFVYFVTAASIPVLYWFLNSKRIIEKLILAGIYMLALTLVLKSNYMTAFLTILIGSAALFVLNSASKDQGNVVWGIVASLAILFVGLNVEIIIGAISHLLPSRISEVLVNGEGSSVTNSVIIEFAGDRWPTIQQSIDSFIMHPILGLLGSGTLGADGRFLAGFGQHSFVADTYALYGVFGGTLATLAIIKSTLNKNVWQKGNALKKTMSILLVLLYFLNNATDSIALVFTIIAPLISIMIDERKEMEG